MQGNEILQNAGFNRAFDSMLNKDIEKAENKPQGSKRAVKTITVKKDKLAEFVQLVATMRKDREQGVEIESDDAVETLNRLIANARELASLPSPFPSFGYYINLNERGYFEADVRDEQGKTVFEIKSGLSLPRGESDLIDDGFMKHGHDTAGLEVHLKSIGIIDQAAKLMPASEFECL